MMTEFQIPTSEMLIQAITGGKAPASPPITIFWGVLDFNKTVYS